MSKSNHFFGQPLCGQLINLLDKEKILELSPKVENAILSVLMLGPTLSQCFRLLLCATIHCVKYLCLCWLKHENYRI